jgi:ATP-dependent RNA helicase SUPV3L1/SUV3
MWYPKAREKKRNVYLHVGPTNSGKTYNALKRLEASSSGTILIYLMILKELNFTTVTLKCYQIS